MLRKAARNATLKELQKTAPNRVLIIVENLPVPFDRRVWQQATTLQREGYEVSVICPKGKGHDESREVLEGVHIYRHPMPVEGTRAVTYGLEYGIALFWQLWLTLRVAADRGFDVIHACNPPDMIFFIAALFKPFGKKFIFDHHDLNPELYEVKFERRDLFYNVLCWLERMTFRLADVSIATNESYRKVAIERGGMAREKTFVVRSGPDLDKFKLEDAPQVEATTDTIVGYLGIMGEQDGIDGLLRVAHEVVVQRKRDDVKFLLIGDGTQIDELKAMAVSLGLADNVEFTGYLRGQDLLSALSRIDIGAVPDPKNDYNDKCTMNKVMEYMSLSKPVVQFDLTESRVSAKDAALYASGNDEQEFADKLMQLVDQPLLREQMGALGRQRMETCLSWEYETPRLLDAYRTVFASDALTANGTQDG